MNYVVGKLELKRASQSISLMGEAGNTPKFAGYAAVFNTVDRDGDQLTANTFVDSLTSATMPPLLWQHDLASPIGRITKLMADTHGLYVEAELSPSGRGKEAYDLLKLRALDGLSVGFVTKEAHRDPQTGVRTVVKAQLAEISLVTFPAHQDARVTDVKAKAQMDPETQDAQQEKRPEPRQPEPRQPEPQQSETQQEETDTDMEMGGKRPEFLMSAVGYERFLREAGASRRDAKALVAKGYKGLLSRAEQVEMEGELTEMIMGLRLATEKLKEEGAQR